MNSWFLVEYEATERQREIERMVRHTALIRRVRNRQRSGLVSRLFSRYILPRLGHPQTLPAKPHSV